MQISKKIKGYALVLGLGIGLFFMKQEEDPDFSFKLNRFGIGKTFLPENNEFYRDQLSLNDLYFQKGIGQQEISLEEVILTETERRNMQTLALESLKEQLTNHLIETRNDPLQKMYLDELNVDLFLDSTFTSTIVGNKNFDHGKNALYLPEENDLDWDRLYRKILKNNTNYVLTNDQCRVRSPFEKGSFLPIEKNLEILTPEDLNNFIKDLRTVVDVKKQEVPNFDMARLACRLSDLVVCYDHRAPKGTAAGIQGNKLYYTVENDRYPDLKDYEQINYHESMHLLYNGCKHEKNSEIKIATFGVEICGLYPTEIAQATANKVDQEHFYLPYRWTFIEESLAEEASAPIANQLPTTYPEDRYVTENIKFSLLLSKEFDPDYIEQAALLHNPIAFIQQFPIPEEESERARTWLVSQLEMLECYNVVYQSQHKDLYDKSLKSLCILEDAFFEDFDRGAIALRLENAADLQLTRNFIWNIAIAKENHIPQLSLEDSCSLMSLFEWRMREQREEHFLQRNLGVYHGLREEMQIDSLGYEDRQEKLKSFFFQYLDSTFANDLDLLGYNSASAYYQDFNLMQNHSFFSLPKEQSTFCQELYHEMEAKWINTSQNDEEKTSRAKVYQRKA